MPSMEADVCATDPTSISRRARELRGGGTRRPHEAFFALEGGGRKKIALLGAEQRGEALRVFFDGKTKSTRLRGKKTSVATEERSDVTRRKKSGTRFDAHLLSERGLGLLSLEDSLKAGALLRIERSHCACGDVRLNRNKCPK